MRSQNVGLTPWHGIMRSKSQLATVFASRFMALTEEYTPS